MIDTFKQDLNTGKKYEIKILSIIKKKYKNAYIVEGYCKEWDIFVPEKNFGIEVKFDGKSKDTGNIVVETHFNNKPSALSTTKAKYWLITDGIFYKWFLVDDIKKCITENKLKAVEFVGRGDTKVKKAYLIKKNVILKYSL